MRNCRDCDIIPDAETTDPVATSHVSPTHDTESAHFLSIPSVESETKHAEYRTIASNSGSLIKRVISSTNVQELSVRSIDANSTVKTCPSAQSVYARPTTNKTEESDLDEEYFPREQRSMPDGEDTSDLSTTEEKDPDSDTSPTKPAARCSGIHAGVEAYDRLDDELNYTDLSMKKSLYADKNLQLPSASTLSKHVRPETHPLCRDELEFHVGQIDCERDTKTDSAPPQEPRQERDGSTSNESLPQDPSKDDLTKPALKQKGMGKHPRHQPIQVQLQGGMRKRKKGKPTKKTASSPEVARRSRKKHKSQHQSAKVPPNGKNSSSSDESSKAQKRPNPATQGSSHKPASTTPVTVTSRKKSPPSGKCAKPQIRFAPDSIAESSKEEGNDPSFVTGHPLYNPAEDHPTTDRSSGDEIRLVTQPQPPDIEVFTEPKEGPFEIDGEVTEQIAKAGMKGVGVAENAQQDFHQESKLSIQAQDPKETVKEDPDELSSQNKEQYPKETTKEESDELSGRAKAQETTKEDPDELSGQTKAVDPKETAKEDPDELSGQTKAQETTKEDPDELSGQTKAQETTKEDPDELSGQTKAQETTKEDPDELSGQTKAQETTKEDPDELSGQTKAQETTKEDPDELSGQTKAQETTKEDPDELSGQTKAQETTKEDPDELSSQTKAQETTKEDPDELSGQTKAADPKETAKEDPDELSGQTKAPDPKETAKEDPDELSGQTKAPDPKETVKEEPDELSGQSKEQDPKVTVKGELSSQAKKQDRNVTVKDELSGQAKAQDRKVPEATTNNPVIIKASLQIDVSATSKEPTLQDNCFPFLSLYGPQEQLIQPVSYLSLHMCQLVIISITLCFVLLTGVS